MRRFLSTLAFGSLAFLAVAVSRAGDLEKLHGTWKLDSTEVRGRVFKPTNRTLSITGDRFTFEETLRPSGAKFTLDTTTNPMVMRKVFDEKVFGMDSETSVFSLSPTRLVIRKQIQEIGQELPKTVEIEPGETGILERWERVGEAPSTSAPIAKQIEGGWKLVEITSIKGETSPPQMYESRKLIKNRRITGTGTFKRTGQIRVDEGTKAVDFIASGKSPVERGIREFIDADTLKLCTVFEPRERPTDFTTKQGDPFGSPTVSIYKRVATPNP